MTPYLDIDGYAALLGVPRSWVRDAVTKRSIQITWFGRHARFSAADVAANEEAGRSTPINAPTGVTNIRDRRRRSKAA